MIPPTIKIETDIILADLKAFFTLSIFPAPIFCPTIEAREPPIPMAGIMKIEFILFPRPKAVITSSPNETINIFNTINPKASPDCPNEEGTPTFNIFLSSFGFILR